MALCQTHRLPQCLLAVLYHLGGWPPSVGRETHLLAPFGGKHVHLLTSALSVMLSPSSTPAGEGSFTTMSHHALLKVQNSMVDRVTEAL